LALKWLFSAKGEPGTPLVRTGSRLHTKEATMRRWFQFRLRSVLLLMTICSVSCGWLGANLRQYQTEQRVLAALGPVELRDVAMGKLNLC